MKNDKDINSSLNNIKKHYVKKKILLLAIRKIMIFFLLENVIEKKVTLV